MRCSSLSSTPAATNGLRATAAAISAAERSTSGTRSASFFSICAVMRAAIVATSLAGASNTTLPLWMNVVTDVAPSAANIADSVAIGSLFLPPTLMPRRSPTCLFERGNASDVLVDDERVDVVGAFVGEYRLDVAHVAAGLILVGDAVGAEQIARVAGDVARHAHVV